MALQTKDGFEKFRNCDRVPESAAWVGPHKVGRYKVGQRPGKISKNQLDARSRPMSSSGTFFG